MNLQDFSALTPFEFEKIYKAWFDGEELRMRESWEQTRFIAMSVLTPYSKRKLKPENVIRFPWDRKKQETTEAKPVTVEKTTRERFEMAKGIFGD